MRTGIAAVLFAAVGTVAHTARGPAAAPFINTWLVAGTFDNGTANTGYDRDWIGEETVRPQEGEPAGDRRWRYFDDRLFSRNYDDYQDLFSYFRVKRNESIAAKVAYAHVYVFSEGARSGQLRIGADNEFKAWLNGALVAQSTESNPARDAVKVDASLNAGWNRLLLKIANQGIGRFGFYARLCDAEGRTLPGLTCSVNGDADALRVSTKPMRDAKTGVLPVAWREWPYVSANASDAVGPETEFFGNCAQLWRDSNKMQSSEFALSAEGGRPPYSWRLVEGRLPRGLALRGDGTIAGMVGKETRLGDCTFRVQVTDSDGRTAAERLSIVVKERPNRWYEEARLTALIHYSESLHDDQFARLARLMKRQGYGVGMPISYNNGDDIYRWPSIFDPDNPLGDIVGQYKAALEAEGIAFGMYMGHFGAQRHGGDNGAILVVDDAMRRYHPRALWFDWAGWPGVSLDAMFSMIRAYNPETVIVLNGIPTIGNGDWDVIVLEGWNAWGNTAWDLWPFNVPWPKKAPVETWRNMVDKDWEYSRGYTSDWAEMLRIQIALIGEGYVANVDHSPTKGPGLDANGKLTSPEASIEWQCHEKMAAWASPAGITPLYESYTRCDPGPLAEAEWGYNTINLARDVIYLHLLKTPHGKSGRPGGDSLTVGPLRQRVTRVAWMNKDRELPFEQRDTTLAINIAGVTADPIDAIIRLQLAGPHPDAPAPLAEPKPIPPGNLASHKPTKLLSLDGTRMLPSSGFAFARYGVDGIISTSAEAGNEWPWTYHVDLERVYPVKRVIVHFHPTNFATEYEIRLSADGEKWQSVARVTGCKGGTVEHAFAPVQARYVRILSIKPDGPGQEGAQMAVAELEVYD